MVALESGWTLAASQDMDIVRPQELVPERLAA